MDNLGLEARPLDKHEHPENSYDYSEYGKL